MFNRKSVDIYIFLLLVTSVTRFMKIFTSLDLISVE
jgi:hypothetical protein